MKIVLDLQSLQTESRNRGIGRYSLALARAMISEGKQHEIYIVLNHAFPESVDAVRQLFASFLPPENIILFRTLDTPYRIDPNEQSHYQVKEIIREYSLERLHPDWVFISSLFEGLDQSTISIGRFTHLKTAITLYDLIPYIHAERYLINPLVKSRYMHQLAYLKQAELLCTISEYTRQEAIDALKLPVEHVINISTDADACFRICEFEKVTIMKLRQLYAINREFILYTAGIEYRKNIEGLIEAYAGLPHELRLRHQLVICCKTLEEESKHLNGIVSKLGLLKDEVVLTGYVSDEDLVALYNLCKLFVFPSLYEGFGLPILEAMRCGAPVIGSSTTSIPEIIGFKEALFDPASIDSISQKLYQALTSDEFRQQLRENGKLQSRKFSWKTSAQRAIEAMEAIHERQQNIRHIITQVNSDGKKPTLAYFSPLPPEKSGIAKYSSELLPELAKFYEIDLVTDLKELSDSWLNTNLKRTTIKEFERSADKYDRILYHFGNSNFHSHMFSLLRKYPGTVVLHDFFLSGVLHYMEATEPESTVFRQALYRSHGYPAIIFWYNKGPDAACLDYPCCLDILQNALGIIVHSEYAIQIASNFFSQEKNRYLVKVPHLRCLPKQKNKAAALKALGLTDRAFLICSFGFVAPTKLDDRLLKAWLNSKLSIDNNCYLIFVGDGQGSDYQKSLQKFIKESKAYSRVKITGYTDDQTYKYYLDAADVAVQLRTHSRGETSGTVIDCLGHEVATVVNSHGSLTELPSDIVVKLPDQFTNNELTEILEHLYDDPSRRELLGNNAINHVKYQLDPTRIAQQYVEAIELFNQNHPIAIQRSLLSAITSLPVKSIPSDKELAEMAEVIADNTPLSYVRQILVDISVLVHEDVNTGIQRVTRSLLLQMLTESLAGYRVEPVYRSAGFYRYARHFTIGFIGVSDFGLEDSPVAISPGDIFFGLDLDRDMDEPARNWLRYQSQRGLKTYFIVHDLLPLFMPEYFPFGQHAIFSKWLEGVASLADGILCVSRTTVNELGKWLSMHSVERWKPLQINHVHNGADFEKVAFTNIDVAAPEKELMTQLANRRSVLMVGTIEPRKGYTQAIEAFEQLWNNGENTIFIIVGKQGWKMEEFVKRIRSHPELKKRLFWFEKASDEILLRLYQTASVLLMASEGEGFGLPLIEGARYKLPIIARDLPVFREIAGDNAFYFSGKEPSDLAEALKSWLVLYQKSEHPRSDGIKWLTWEESARQLKQVIFESRWKATWDIKSGFRWDEEKS